MLTPLDYGVMVVYFALVVAIGLVAAGRQAGTADYFLGGRDLPWWAICFSIVATETSTLTIIGIPAVAYGGAMTFLQLTFGYLIGRAVVAAWFLPHYFDHGLPTAYAYLGERFGSRMRVIAAMTFMVTRLLGDGVRLFATAIPVKVVLDSAGVEASYPAILAIIGIVTIAYTMLGGLKAVVWTDVVQMSVYLIGGILAVVTLVGSLPSGWVDTATAAGKFQVLNFELGESFVAVLTSPYSFVTAVIGGAVFNLASHGVDQIIVQRLLACRDRKDATRALLTSGLIVIAQFALFLIIGVLLWAHHGGASLESLGVARGDEIFPRYIISGLPPGVSGILLAAIIAAAMSTLSSSLNSLASSSVADLYQRISRAPEDRTLLVSRLFTLFWGILFIGFASLFTDQETPVVELGLTIATFTYGGLLGSFLLGLLAPKSKQSDALIAFAVAILLTVITFFGVWHDAETGWRLVLAPSDAEIAAEGLQRIAWPWFTLIGAGTTVLVGWLLSLRRPGSAAAPGTRSSAGSRAVRPQPGQGD